MANITREEYEKIRNLKELDIQSCSYCQRLNILNLGWKPFGNHYCRKHEVKHVLCWELCYRACVNILKCELQQKKKEIPTQPVKPNRPYDWASCYSCGKELKGAGKTGKIKNRNDPRFWGINSVYRILCLECVGRKFYNRLVDWQRKKFREYVRRRYV